MCTVCGNCLQNDFHDGPKGYSCGNSSACYFLWPLGTDGEMRIPHFYSPLGRRNGVDCVVIFTASLFRRTKYLHPIEGRLGHVTRSGPWNEESIQVMSLPSWGTLPSLLSLCQRPAQAHRGDNAGSLWTTAKVAVTIRRVTQILLFPSVYKNYVYTLLKSI